MPVYIGGAELNAATALAKWGMTVKYVTALPDNYLSKEITEDLSEKNINIEDIIWRGERIGSYYLPQGADLKNNAVIYDRKYSSFSFLKPGDINWDIVFKDVSWFHFSAISPALNLEVAAVCMEAIKIAHEKGITVSVDLNYRSKLWQYGKTPDEVMIPMLHYCDVIMGNIWAAEKMAGISLSQNFDAHSGNKDLYLEESNRSAEKIMNNFSNCKTVVNTFRFDKEKGIEYYAAYHDRNVNVQSAVYNVEEIVDRIGSGDCLMAGLIYGLSRDDSPQQIIDFAAAAAVAKLQQKGDATTSSTADINNMIQHG